MAYGKWQSVIFIFCFRFFFLKNYAYLGTYIIIITNRIVKKCFDHVSSSSYFSHQILPLFALLQTKKTFIEHTYIIGIYLYNIYNIRLDFGARFAKRFQNKSSETRVYIIVTNVQCMKTSQSSK